MVKTVAIRLVTVCVLSVIISLTLALLPAIANAQEPIVGEIRLFSGSSGSVPDGWLLADGSAISRTYYADLFNVITTTYGSGDGSTTFNLPDMQARFPVGANSTMTYTLAITGGEEFHTLTEDEMPSHNHQSVANFNSTDGDVTARGSNSLFNFFLQDTSFTGGDQPHNNVPPYLAVNFIIYAGPPAPDGGGEQIYLPFVYSHTLQSGHLLLVPVQASFGQLINAGLMVSVIVAVALLVAVEVVYQRRREGGVN